MEISGKSLEIPENSHFSPLLKVKLWEKMNFQNFPEISGLVDFLPQGQDQETYQNQISYEDITKCYEEISYEEISRELLEASYETCEKKN